MSFCYLSGLYLSDRRLTIIKFQIYHWRILEEKRFLGSTSTQSGMSFAN